MILGDEELAILLGILDRAIPDREVWAFGSRVHRRLLKPFSDIDLALVGADPVSPARLSELREMLDESDLPYRVDLVDMAAVGSGFAEIIRRDHEVIKLKAAATSS